MSDEKKKKPPRKISCLPCRTKKAKCDGGIPHCNRCIRNSRENKCIYPKPRTFGRPPKNAVFHKNQDTIMNTEAKDNELVALNSNHDTSDNVVACREFIFENQYDMQPTNLSIREQQERQHQLILSTNKRSPHLSKYTAQILDIERIFSLYISRGTALREKLLDFKLNPPFKMKTLHQHFTWVTSSLINITIKRSCQMIELESFYDPELTIAAFMKSEDINVFFFNMGIQDNKSRNTDSSNNEDSSKNQCSTTRATPNSSPLNSIPTDQAIQLIDYFFQLHPYCILLNKTKILNDYWNDSIEPLLLCTIYGITIYTCQQALKGKPFVLRAINRNPFLNYAYVLLEKFFLQRDQYQNASGVSSPSSLGTYQATVILGIFETLYGFSKHGMTIISLSYMIASDLGVFQSEDSSKQSEKISTMDPIDREQLVNTYWAALRSTAYGCMELGLYLRESLLFHGQPFPPANIHTSASYQYDLLHNNHTSSSSYLIESFHTEMVITYFSSKLFACLPKTEHNLFGCPTTPPNPPSIGELLQQQYNVLIQLLDAAAAANSHYDTMVDYQIQRVLNDFKAFIDQECHQWSSFQLYMIESTYLLYCIHFKFIRSQNDIAPIRYHKIISELNLADTRITSRITKLLPKTNKLIYKLQTFLCEHNNEIEDLDEKRIALLPLGLMMTTLETTIRLMTFHYQLDPQNQEILDQLRNLYSISNEDIWNHCGPVAKTIQKKFREFLKFHQIPILASQHQANDHIVATRFNEAIKTNHDVVALVQPPEIFLKESTANINREEALISAAPTPTASSGAGDVSFLFLEEYPTSPTASNSSMLPSSTSPSSEYFQAIDSSFLKEFDDIFKQAIDINVSP